jgi:hypothetical protein
VTSGEPPEAADHTDGMAIRTRDGSGRFDRSPDVAARDAECARLRARSMTYRQIGAALGITPGMAHEGVKRALADTLEEAAEDVRRLELDKLDALERRTLAVLDGQHIVVSNGRVAMLNGAPIPDTGPILAAVQLLTRISESRRKLLGLDMPAKVTVDGGVRYEVVGVDAAALT